MKALAYTRGLNSRGNDFGTFDRAPLIHSETASIDESRVFESVLDYKADEEEILPAIVL